MLTARNIDGNWSIDLVYGGLNYPIEHHVFPSMPGNNLRRVLPPFGPIVKGKEVAYWETGLVESWLEIVVHFGSVSRPLNT